MPGYGQELPQGFPDGAADDEQVFVNDAREVAEMDKPVTSRPNPSRISTRRRPRNY